MSDLGFINVDKPAKTTSHSVVKAVRKGIQQKVGHAGTLDPMATGVLVLCIGKATRLCDFIMAHNKVYQAEVHLGVETDTYDADGKVIRTSDKIITRDMFAEVLPRFQGDIQQVPPMYSAIKKGGKKLYELARKGEKVELEPRPVSIYSLSITDWYFPRVSIRVSCSSGTYVRSLAHDIGEMLGIGAHLSDLRRIASGKHFRIDNAVTLETLKRSFADDSWPKYLVSPDIALDELPAFNLTALQAKQVKQGAFIQIDSTADGPAPMMPMGPFLPLWSVWNLVKTHGNPPRFLLSLPHRTESPCDMFMI